MKNILIAIALLIAVPGQCAESSPWHSNWSPTPNHVGLYVAQSKRLVQRAA